MLPAPRHAPLARLLGGALFLGGAFLSASAAPRLVWLNTGVSVEHGRAAAVAALAAAAGAALFALTLRRRRRLACAALALLALALGGQRLRYRVSAEAAGLAERGLLGGRTLPWRDVSRVESGSSWLLVVGSGDEQVRIWTASFAGEDRARLERTIARRVREASGRAR